MILVATDTILIVRGESPNKNQLALPAFFICKNLVFALYHENITMRRVVAIFFIVEMVGMAIGLGLALPGITYDNLCLVINVPRSIIIYAYAVSSRSSFCTHINQYPNASSAAAIVFQAFLFMVTIYKFVLAVRSGWGDVPLIVLLTRDGTWAFCVLFCTSSSV